ncbi:MAG: reductase anchor subunit (DmsC) [Clostridiales bacterium]|jgi:anaerobic dimethyl sulfoxide reductase subunit C (anchor subunit)|nr:reductase anchor subunit (DmsC) [Clostridiales bacterium]
MGEMTLVFFTVLSQLAAGSIVTLWLLEVNGKKITTETGKLVTITLLLITGFSILISLFHLGHPLEAYRALTNLGNSWLSREVILFTSLIVMLATYYFQWQEGKEKNRKVLGGITALVAVLAVISSGMIYVLPARPAWNNVGTVVFFILTAALLGPLYIEMLFTIKKKSVANLPVILVSIIGIYTISFIIYVSVLISGTGTEYQTGINIITSSTFWGRIIVGLLAPFSLLVFKSLNKVHNSKLITTIFLLAFIGEILGRTLFYSSIVALQIAAF